MYMYIWTQQTWHVNMNKDIDHLSIRIKEHIGHLKLHDPVSREVFVMIKGYQNMVWCTGI